MTTSGASVPSKAGCVTETAGWATPAGTIVAVTATSAWSTPTTSGRLRTKSGRAEPVPAPRAGDVGTAAHRPDERHTAAGRPETARPAVPGSRHRRRRLAVRSASTTPGRGRVRASRTPRPLDPRRRPARVPGACTAAGGSEADQPRRDDARSTPSSRVSPQLRATSQRPQGGAWRDNTDGSAPPDGRASDGAK
jgi:hypothetical protein